MEVDIIELEDNKNYYIIDEKVLNGSTYILLSSVDNKKDMCIRKRIQKDGKNIISMLSDVNELQEALELFRAN